MEGKKLTNEEKLTEVNGGANVQGVTTVPGGYGYSEIHKYKLENEEEIGKDNFIAKDYYADLQSTPEIPNGVRISLIEHTTE